jgi:crossover junction endodeoxyribonuclease RuvC
MRVLGLDLSLTSPGFAVIEVKKGKPRLIKTANFTTDSGTSSGAPLRRNRGVHAIIYSR